MANPTTLGGYPKQDQGENQDDWGTNSTDSLNQAIDLLSEGIHSVLAVAMTGDTTLTSTNYASNQYRRAALKLTDGGLSSAPTITAPSVENVYRIWNATGYVVGFKTSGGSAVSLATGMGHVVACDGTDCFVITAKRLDQLDAPTSAVAMGSQKITGLATGTDGTDAVNVTQMNLAIASAGVPATSGAVKVSSDDTASRFLEDVIEVESGELTAETQNAGGDETLKLGIAPDYLARALATSIALNE